MLALAEHRSADAITAARTWNRSWEEILCTTCGLYELAQAFEQAGQPDSALAAYRQLVDAPGYGSLQAASYAFAPAWRRLGSCTKSAGRAPRPLMPTAGSPDCGRTRTRASSPRYERCGSG